jgi:hypothetical protein
MIAWYRACGSRSVHRLFTDSEESLAMDNTPTNAVATALHQINEDDLACLERTLPQLGLALMPILNNRLRVQLRQVQRILSDVRWNYGPPGEVETIRAEGA